MANPYQEMEIRTTDPVGLVLRLYDGALRFLRMAREHHAASRIQQRGEAIARTLAILSELRSALDMERGEQIARGLDDLYAFSIERLIEANLREDPRGVDEVIQVLEPLREAWAELSSRAVAANP